MITRYCLLFALVFGISSTAKAAPVYIWEIGLSELWSPITLHIDYGNDTGFLDLGYDGTLPVLNDLRFLEAGILPSVTSGLDNPPGLGYEYLAIGLDFPTMQAAILIHSPDAGIDNRVTRAGITSVRLLVPEPSEAGLVALLGLALLGWSVVRGDDQG